MKNILKEFDEMQAFQNTTLILNEEGEKTMSDDLGFQPTDAASDGDDLYTPDFSETHEEVTMPAGSEVQLRIISIKSGQDKHGAPDRRILLEISDEPYAKLVNYYMGLPGPNDDARKKNQKNLKLQKFMTAFSLPLGTINWPSLIGMTAWAILSYVPAGEYPEKNEVDKWVKSS